MNVYIAGTGKLATELLQGLASVEGLSISPWADGLPGHGRGIVVHAGSGRQLDAISAFCARTQSTLVELSTGSVLEGAQPGFPVVLCPNTNVLMLKFMCMLERSGAFFNGAAIQVTESHQASKVSVPGTAVHMARSLALPEQAIESVRDPQLQAGTLGIPEAHLARHAFHRITIEDGPCSVVMETRVYGDAPYASGVQQIIKAISSRELSKRVYTISEFIENGWV